MLPRIGNCWIRSRDMCRYLDRRGTSRTISELYLFILDTNIRSGGEQVTKTGTEFLEIGAHDGMHLFSCLNERGVNFSFLTAMRVSMVSSR